MLIFWIIFFEIAVLYFCSSTLLLLPIGDTRSPGCVRADGDRRVTNNVAVYQGSSSVMMTSYVPMMAAPSFYLGLILFAVGALIGCFVFLGTLVVAKREKTYEGSVPLVTFGAITACIIAVFTIASGAIILIPTFLMSIGVVEKVDPLVYRTIWWAFGHSSQQINVAAHISIWYAVAAIAFGAKPMSERVSRGAFLLYILFLQLASAHHLLADPGLSTGWKVVNTSYFMYFAVLASMIHGLTIPARWRLRAARQRASTRAVRMAAQGALGQPGVLRRVHLAHRVRLPRRHLRRDDGHRAAQHDHPQHHLRAGALPRHGGGGTTLSFMALTYFLIPVLFKREMIAPAWRRSAVPVRPVDVLLLPGDDGRRHARRLAPPLGHGVQRARAGLPVAGRGLPDDGLVGIAGVAAIAGGAIYIYVTVGSLLWASASRPARQRQLHADSARRPRGGRAEPTASPASRRRAPSLAMVFLVAFVLYYFINWKYLSQVWGLS